MYYSGMLHQCLCWMAVLYSFSVTLKISPLPSCHAIVAFRECKQDLLYSKGKHSWATSEHVPQKQYPPGVSHVGYPTVKARTIIPTTCNEKREISSTWKMTNSASVKSNIKLCTYIRKKAGLSQRFWCRQLQLLWPSDERFKSSIEQVDGVVSRGCPLRYWSYCDVTV